MATSSSTSKKKRVFCDHCQQLVGYSTYYRHRDRFFDTQSSSWVGTSAAEGRQSASASSSPSDCSDIDGRYLWYEWH